MYVCMYVVWYRTHESELEKRFNILTELECMRLTSNNNEHSCTVPLRYTLTAQTRIIRTYAYEYTHIRVCLYTHTRMIIRELSGDLPISRYSRKALPESSIKF